MTSWGQILEARILRAIANPKVKRAGVAEVYALALGRAVVDDIDWSAVNEAIIERWSVSGLQWIKTRAWQVRGTAGLVYEVASREIAATASEATERQEP